MSSLRHWVKSNEHPLARCLYRLAKAMRRIEVPVLPGVHGTLFKIHRSVTGGYQAALRILYWTPLFKSQLAAPAPALWLDGAGLPGVAKA